MKGAARTGLDKCNEGGGGCQEETLFWPMPMQRILMRSSSPVSEAMFWDPDGSNEGVASVKMSVSHNPSAPPPHNPPTPKKKRIRGANQRRTASRRRYSRRR